MKQTILSSIIAAVIVAILGWIYTQTSAGFNSNMNQKINNIVQPLKTQINSVKIIAEDALKKSEGAYLQCTETQWGIETGCGIWPTAAPPSCSEGYEFVGISVESHTDQNCGVSMLNNQKVKGMCCKVNYR